MKLVSELNLSETDDDCSKEVDQMKIKFDAKLKAEDAAGVALMAEHAVLKKNLQINEF